MGKQRNEERIQRETHFLLEALRKTQGGYSAGRTASLPDRWGQRWPGPLMAVASKKVVLIHRHHFTSRVSSRSRGSRSGDPVCHRYVLSN